MTLTREFVFLYLYEQLSPALKAAGFSLRESKQQFRRAHERGFENLILSVSPYPDVVVVDAHFGIRIDAVEEVAQRFTRNLPGFYPDAHTLIASYGRLTGQPYFRFKAANTHHLDMALESLLAFWEGEGLPFLNEWRRLPQAEHSLNGQPDKPCPYLHNQAHRYIKGIVAARLVGREAFSQLARQYEAALEQVPGGELLLPGYRQLVQYLHHLSPN
ncbi:MAG: hypothetical protein D6722_26960 [Bacteroidetes bacterium]|nr:MAG: hypothetical protein D6722_26960 [Bacteroidota bacterium]